MNTNRVFSTFLSVAVFSLSACGSDVFSGSESDESNEIVATCGNDILENGEQCDGGLEPGETCQTLGYESGSLSCSEQCLFITTDCVAGAGDVVIGQVDQTELASSEIRTLTGVGFGLKNPVAPVLFDDLSSSAYSGLSDGDVIPTRNGDNGSPEDPNAPWYDQGSTYSNPMTFATSNTRVEGRPNYRVEERGYLLEHRLPTSESKMFISYWFRGTEMNPIPENGDLEYNEDGEPLSASNKMMRIWPDGNNSIGHISALPHRISYDTCCTAAEDDSSSGNFYSKEGSWAHIQVYVNSSGYQTGDATIETWQDGEKTLDIRDLWGNTNYYNLRMIGYEPNRGGYYTGEFYEMSDIYIDNTQARIQVCDAGTWGDVLEGAHCEIQIPVQTWIDGQAKFRVNQGDFDDGAHAFIYLINASGVVNFVGLPVSF